MSCSKIFLIALLLLSLPVLANDVVDLEQLEPLIGSWKLKNPTSDEERAFRLNYRWISRGTTLVETWGNPAANTTQTLYHHADGELMATHYCARGNQPRLLAQPESEANLIEFKFHDITNLSDHEDPHMVAMRFRLIDEKHMEKTETYLVKSEPHTSVMSMVRESD